MKISEIRIGKRFRKELGDIHALVKSIDEIGLLHPIVVTPKGALIAGQRRLKALQELGRPEIPVHVVDLEEIMLGEFDENTVRMDFQPSEKVAIGKAMEPLEKKEAKERQGTRTDKHPGNLPESSKGDRRDKAAAFADWSGRTYEKAKAVVEAAEEEPEKYGDLVAEMDRTGRVSGVHRKLTVRKKSEQIKQEPPPLGKGPFRVIVADPPWSYQKRSGDPSHRPALPYPAMSLEEIEKYPVPKIAHKDCILWLWTTNAFMEHAFGVARAWGFEPKTILTWIKDKMGTGDWLRGQTEHCLMCVKGKPTVTLKNQTTVLYGKRTEHSRKPDEFYEMVALLCPTPANGKRDLFSREKRKNWITDDDLR